MDGKEEKGKRKIGLIYPPGKMYQRGEDRSQGNIEDSSATAMRACNDLGYAAAVLLEKGHQVFLRDFQTEKCSMRDVIFDLKREKLDVICISTTNATIYGDIEVINKIKKYFPSLHVVLKGSIFYNPEMKMLDLLDLGNIDFLIGGEIDFAIRNIIDELYGSQEYGDVDNILYKDKEGGWVKTRFHVWGEDLDGLPFPARHLMKNELYVRPDTGRPMATIQAARGCPASCIYCLSPDISGKKIRKRSPQNVFGEIRECYFKYGIRDFFFKADTFTIDAGWVTALCKLIIQSDLYQKIEFTANSRVNPLSKEVLAIMKKAGCFAVAFGFESGSDETLKKIRKGTTAKQNIQAMHWAKELKLPVYGFFIIGFPWETRRDIALTGKHIFELDPDFMEIHIALPYYGTGLYEECKKEQVLEENVWGSDYFHSSTSGTKYVPMEELAEIRKKIMLRFYLRPSYILKKAVYSIKRPVVLKNYMKYGLRLVKNLLFPAGFNRRG